MWPSIRVGNEMPTVVHEASRKLIAVIGNPNTGKSTLFNTLTGLKQKTANYPGVTVERHTGQITLDQDEVTLVDLPGTYSLAAQSPDEMIAIDVLLGHVEDLAKPGAILVVVDATNLTRNLFLVTQLAELGLPLVIALNMSDLAAEQGITIDTEALGQALGAIVIPVVATKGKGLAALRVALTDALNSPSPEPLVVLPEVHQTAKQLWGELQQRNYHLSAYEVERALIDAHGVAERRFEYITDNSFSEQFADARARLSTGSSLAAIEARSRYQLVSELTNRIEQREARSISVGDRLDRITSHPLVGSILFILVMAAVFQAVFSWATPVMELIEQGTGWLSLMLMERLPPGALASLVVDGAIAGVGSVLIFLPQILILFAFIIFLEDSGYMPRAAFLMDRLMRACGLSGQSFIPMLSSFACAVPGILATRVVPDRRDRIATILAAPFMTCSARLPIYALLIAAFVPPQTYLNNSVNLQGLVLLCLYLLGIIGGILTAWLLKKTLLRGPTPGFLIELPPYRLPNMYSMGIKLLKRGKTFLVRAGTVIFSVSLVIWALAYFPRSEILAAEFEAQRTIAAESMQAAELGKHLSRINAREAAAALEQSYLGRMGKLIAPVFEPLGWDWKISAAVIAGFPAREVVIAALGTIYAVGDENGSTKNALIDRLRSATRPDGGLVFTVPMVLGLLVFYALCLQCVATIVMIRRETETWRWPIFAWSYMTGLAYLSALLIYQVGS